MKASNALQDGSLKPKESKIPSVLQPIWVPIKTFGKLTGCKGSHFVWWRWGGMLVMDRVMMCVRVSIWGMKICIWPPFWNGRYFFFHALCLCYMYKGMVKVLHRNSYFAWVQVPSPTLCAQSGLKVACTLSVNSSSCHDCSEWLSFLIQEAFTKPCGTTYT